MTEAPQWASKNGRDDATAWAAFTVDGVAQRLRWVAPGLTVMGSPDTEAGRAPQEGPARIEEVTAGFWLAETPVTEALWAAVTRAPAAPGRPRRRGSAT